MVKYIYNTDNKNKKYLLSNLLRAGYEAKHFT